MQVSVRKEIYTKLVVICDLEVPDDFAANEHGVLTPEHRIYVEDALTGEKLVDKVTNLQRIKPETQEVQYFVTEPVYKEQIISSWYYQGGTGVHVGTKQ